MLARDAIPEATEATGVSPGALPCFRGMSGFMCSLKLDALASLPLNNFLAACSEFFCFALAAVFRVFDVALEHIGHAAGVFPLRFIDGRQLLSVAKP